MPKIWDSIMNWLSPRAQVQPSVARPVITPYDPFANISFNYPPEVADVAEETLARYMRYAERTQPSWTPSEQRYLAVMLAEANLSDRAAFRREVSEYTQSPPRDLRAGNRNILGVHLRLSLGDHGPPGARGRDGRPALC